MFPALVVMDEDEEKQVLINSGKDSQVLQLLSQKLEVGTNPQSKPDKLYSHQRESFWLKLLPMTGTGWIRVVLTISGHFYFLVRS